MMTRRMRLWTIVSGLHLVVTAPLLAQQAPQPPSCEALLQEALDREARLRQTIGWLGPDSNGSQRGQIFLLQGQYDKLKADDTAKQQKLDDLSKQLDALKKETPGVAQTQ